MASYIDKEIAGLDVNSSLEGIDLPNYTSTRTNKLAELEARRTQKIENLSGQKLDELTGDAFYDRLDALSQQSTNNLTAEELQYGLGYTAGDQILTDDQGRYKFKTDPITGKYVSDDQGNWIKDYTDEKGRNLYIDNTEEGDYKLGLALEDKGFTGRYTPDWKQYVPGMRGYGWEPGPKGVTPEDGALMDVTTNYDAATDFEKVVHSNVGQIKNRSIGQGPIDALDDYYYGSGKTEYTKDTAPMWNIGYKDDGKALEAGTPLPGESRAATGFVEPDQIDNDTKLTKALKAGFTAFTKEVAVDTVDWLAEATGLGDLGTEEEKTKMVNSWVNYNPQNLQEATKKVGLLTNEAINQIKAGNVWEGIKLLGEGVVTSAKEPELFTSSVFTIAAWAMPGSILTKGTKLARNAEKAAEITARSGGKVKGIEIGSAEGLKTLMKKQSGYTAAAIGNVNDQYEEFVKNNDGVELEGVDKFEYFATRIPLQMFNQNLDAITAVSIIRSPSMFKQLGAAVANITKKEFGKVAVNIGKSIASVAASMPKEAAQEYSQRMMELFNERYGSEQFKDLDTFFKFMVDEGNMREAAVDAVMGAGGAVQFKAVGGVVGNAGKLFKGKVVTAEEQINSARNESIQNVAGKKEVKSEGIELEADIGVPLSSDVFTNTEVDEEIVDVITANKNKIIDDNFVVENGEIIGVKSPETISVNSIKSWFKDYENVLKNEGTGKLPEAVQAELDAVISTLNDLETGTVAGKVSEGLDAIVENNTEEEVIKEVDRRTDIVIDALGITDNKEEVKARTRQRVLDTYGISGFGGIDFDIDPDVLADIAKEEAGLKTKLDQKMPNKGAKAVNVGLIKNEDIEEVLQGKGVPESKIPSDADNTKLRNRVLRKLDPMTSKNVNKTLTEANAKMDPVVASNEKEAGKYFKQGDIKGNMKRLMVVAMSTINAATDSDTEGRRSVDSDNSMLAKDEYYAGMSGTMEQIGKDYASSYGLKLKGSPEQLAKTHRDLGRFAIKMLQEADLVEVSADNILSRAGNVQTVSNERLLSAKEKKGVYTDKGTDALTKEEVLLVQDKGIRLKDTLNMFDKNDASKTKFEYTSATGDAMKRVAKLILPNSERVPSTTKNTGNVKVADGIKVKGSILKGIREHSNKSMTLKKNKVIRGTLDHLANLNKSSNGGLNALRAKDDISAFLALKDSGSDILAVRDSGSTMSKLDNIIGILDNLDTLDQDIYYTFQVDINNRLTIIETIANYQSDKVYARQLMTAGEYTISGDNVAEREVFVNYLIDELANKEERKQAKNMTMAQKEEMLDAYANTYNTILKQSTINGELDYNELIDFVSGTMSKGKLSHLNGSGGIKALSLLQAAKDLQDSNGGDITTEFMVEKDASASGVFNNLINMAGIDPEAFKKILLRLNVKFGEDEVGKGRYKDLSEIDAYRMLSEVIEELIKKNANGADVVSMDVEGLNAVNKINSAIRDDKLLRELAKYPIMTWFYSAEEKSIKENLTAEMTKTLIEKAIDGDQGVLSYLSDVTGVENLDIDGVKAIKVGSKEHKALRAELNKIGAVYYKNLDKAFPGVKKRKKEMEEYYDFLANNSTVGEEDYWKGRVRTAVGTLDGSDSTMSLYQLKNIAMDLSAAEKIEKGITTDDESLTLVTMMDKMPNSTSMMPLMAHSIDAAQAIYGLMNMPSDVGVMSVHDGFYGRPKDLLAFQRTAEKVTKEVAIEYDMVNEMARAMRETAKSMRKAASESKSNSKELKKQADILEQKATEIETKNNPLIEAKKQLLENAETRLFGKDGYVDAGTDEDVNKQAKAEKAKPESQEEKTKLIYADLKAIVKDLVWAEDRLDIAKDELAKVNLLTPKVGKKLLASVKDKGTKNKIEMYIKENKSFSYNGVAYVGTADVAGLKNEMFNRVSVDTDVLDTSLLADVVLHEIEHAVSDKFIEKEANGNIKNEYAVLGNILDKAHSQRARAKHPRVKYILDSMNEVGQLQGIKELVAISKEADSENVFKELNELAGVTKTRSLVQRIIDKIADYFNTKTIDELMADVDVYTLHEAVQNIRLKAREDKGVVKAENATITKLKDNISSFCK